MNQIICPSCGKTHLATEPCPDCALEPIGNAAAFSPCPDSGSVRSGVYPKCEFSRRSIAAVVDFVISMLGMLLMLPGIMMLGTASPSDAIAWLLISIGAVWVVFYAYTKDGFKHGQSWGKRSMGLMVVRLEDNRPCTKASSVLRSVLYAIPYVGSVVPIADIAMILSTSAGLKCGDKLAGTQVIKVTDYKP